MREISREVLPSTLSTMIMLITIKYVTYMKSPKANIAAYIWHFNNFPFDLCPKLK